MCPLMGGGGPASNFVPFLVFAVAYFCLPFMRWDMKNTFQVISTLPQE